MIKHLCLGLFTSLFTLTLSAQSLTLEQFILDSLDIHVQRGMARWDIPGTAVCIVKDGKVLLSKGYGVCDKTTNAPVNEHTLFMIGSNSKAFTGTALAMLANDKKCDLSDPVQKWLPKFTMKDPWVAEHLNLSDIVSHRIGMETFQGDFTYWTSDLTADEVIAHFGKFTPIYGFRTKWGYTNAGFAIAGACMQTISGKSWADNIRERIFQPLEMNRSLPLSAEVAKASNVAQPHTQLLGKTQRIPFAIIDNLAPAGSIGSSVNDMGHWVMANLNQGAYKDKIPAAVIRSTRKPLSMLGRDNRAGHHYVLYGMGWLLEDYYGKEIVSHTGGVNGYVTAVTLLPELGTGIVVLTNTDANGFYQSLNQVLVDAAVGAPYQDHDASAFQNQQEEQMEQDAIVKKMRDTVAMAHRASLDLDAYTGKYTNEMYGFTKIEKDEKALKMTFEHHAAMTARLEPLGGDRFLCTYSDPMMGVRVFPFTVKDKKVEGFTLSVADFVEFTTYDFKKE